MFVFGVWDSGRSGEITQTPLGRDVVAYVEAARAVGDDDDQIENDLYEQLDHSSAPADNVHVHGKLVVVEFFK